MGILLILVDGIGLGDQEPDKNPMAVARTRWFQCFRDHISSVNGRLVIPTDASLGVPGLPQSATGQTALLRRLLDEERRQGKRFERLALALTALYPEKSQERRWLEGVQTMMRR